MIWTTDTQGRCTYVSKELSELTGRIERDGLGSGWLEIVHPRDKNVVERTLAEACRTRQAFSLQYRMKVVNDGYMWVLAGAVPSFGPPDHKFLGFLGSITEVEPGTALNHAVGRVGSFHPPQPRPSTMPVSPVDITADHLLLARAAAQHGNFSQAIVAIDLALEIVGRLITRLRPVGPTLN